jgi:UDP-N-acetylmuramate dehydrogenase
MKTSAGRQKTSIDLLPPVRGRIEANAPLRRLTWFRVGGPAEILFAPADVRDLQDFLKSKPAKIPVTFIGLGANILVRDGGIPGVVIRLGRPFSSIRVNGPEIEAGAMALDYNVAKACLRAGVAGFEFMAGIPGTIGGGLRMNAGAYGSEFSDRLIRAEAIDPQGTIHRLSKRDWAPRYRGCGVPKDWIFVTATFCGIPGDPESIAHDMAEIQASREATQPIRMRTGGSTFKNPPNEKAWELIDRAGCRGLAVGKAMVSEKHCNFLINTGGATASDIEQLGEEVRRRVKASTGIALQWEIERLGDAVSNTNGYPPA